MLQNLDDSLAKARCEAFEDQVRVGFADGATRAVRDIVAKNDIVEGERSGWTVREVRESQSCRCATVFMQKNHV